MARRILSVVVAVFALVSAVSPEQAPKELGSPHELTQGGTLLRDLPFLRLGELCPEVGDGVSWSRRRIVGVFEPPLFH